MSTWFDQYWSGTKSVILATWPEVPAKQLFMDTTLERYDWINLLNKNQMNGAWVAVKLSIVPGPEDWSPDWNTNQITAKIHYVTPGAFSPDGVSKTVSEFITRKLTLLSRAFLRTLDCGSVLTSTPIGINSDDEINQVVIGAKVPYQAGAMEFTSVIEDIGTI